MDEFGACFAEAVDPRQDNARQDLHERLLIALCTILTGGKDCLDAPRFGELVPFLRQFLRLRHGIPSHDTFSRVFRLLDPAPFEACFKRFVQRFAETLQGVVVAIDSKTLRRSFDRAAGKSPLHVIHAMSANHRRRLGQLAVGGRSNEITAVPKLLDLLSLKGRIVTADGPHPRDRPSG